MYLIRDFKEESDTVSRKEWSVAETLSSRRSRRRHETELDLQIYNLTPILLLLYMSRAKAFHFFW